MHVNLHRDALKLTHLRGHFILRKRVAHAAKVESTVSGILRVDANRT